MKPHPRALLPAFAALLAAVVPGVARAAERDCPAIAIEPDAGFRVRFPQLLERIQTELSARTDIDACARVALRLQANVSIEVSVTLPDGRAAARRVERDDDVIPTLQALLLVPDHVEAAPKTAPSAPAPRQRQAPHASWPSRVERDVPSAPVTAPRRLGVEVSAISGARVGDGQFGYGAGALSLVEIYHWLVGFEGRADGYRSLLGGDPETALELAILTGRRFDFESVALDLTLGPGVAMKGFSLSQTQSVRVDAGSGAIAMPPPAPPPESSSGPVPRLLLGARLGFSPRSVFRSFIGVDAEVGPTRDPAIQDASASPRMPRFTVGLALGATVGTP
jgi:hypothetical protein